MFAHVGINQSSIIIYTCAQLFIAVCQMNTCTANVLIPFFSFIKCSCLNQCTYCKTKHARGDLGSYPPEEIVARAKQAFEGRLVFEIYKVHVTFSIYCSCTLYFCLHLTFLKEKKKTFQVQCRGWLQIKRC